MPNTLKHPDYIGSGKLDTLIQKRVNITSFATDADSLACLQLGFIDRPFAGSTPAVTPHAATYAVDGGDKTLIIAVKNKGVAGGNNSDVSFTITFAAAKAAWSAGAASAYSLKDVIDLLNEDDAGGTSGKLLACIKAQIGIGGRYDMVMNGADAFLDESAAYIMDVGVNQAMTSGLKRDMAVHTEDSDFILYWRLGLPEVKDRRSFKLLDLWGAIGTTTGCSVYVVRDDDEDYVVPGGTWATDFANHELIFEVTAASLAAGAGAANALNHNPSEAASVRGPLLVIVKGDTDAAQTVVLNAVLQAAL